MPELKLESISTIALDLILWISLAIGGGGIALLACLAWVAR